MEPIKDKQALQNMLEAVVDKPNEIKIERTRDDMGILLTVQLGEGDAGRVIGHKGRTLDAIRRIMRVVGRTEDARVNVKLDVPDRQ